MSNLLWLLGTIGINSIGITGVASMAGIGALGVAALKAKWDTDKEESRKEKVQKQFEKIETDKKKIAVDLFNEEQVRHNEEVKVNFDNMIAEKKENELNNYRLVESTCDMKYPYKGIKPPTMYDLLIGHTDKGEPVWGTATNYIIAGTTGAGKSRKMYPIILNYLAAQQGTLYIADLKGSDFFMFKDKRHVVKYVNDLENAPEIIKAFEAEYKARKQLFADGGYINIDDYNERTGSDMRLYTMVIDEYADVADTFHDKNGRPIGCYADLVRLARKVRSTGGRIILGTQRPDATVICGQLKNNCNVIGLQCVNTISSNVMVGSDGCERLKPTEALTVINGKLSKVFAYMIDNARLDDCVNKLK